MEIYIWNVLAMYGRVYKVDQSVDIFYSGDFGSDFDTAFALNIARIHH